MNITEFIDKCETDINTEFSTKFNSSIIQALKDLTESGGIVWTRTYRSSKDSFYYHGVINSNKVYKLNFNVFLESFGVLDIYTSNTEQLYKWELGITILEDIVKIIVRSIGQTVIQPEQLKKLKTELNIK